MSVLQESIKIKGLIGSLSFYRMTFIKSLTCRECNLFFQNKIYWKSEMAVYKSLLPSSRIGLKKGSLIWHFPFLAFFYITLSIFPHEASKLIPLFSYLQADSLFVPKLVYIVKPKMFLLSRSLISVCKQPKGSIKILRQS